MAELSDDRLAAILASVGDHLVVPTGTPTDRLTSTVPPPNGSAPHDDDRAHGAGTADATSDREERAEVAERTAEGRDADGADVRSSAATEQPGRAGRAESANRADRAEGADQADRVDLAVSTDRADRVERGEGEPNDVDDRAPVAPVRRRRGRGRRGPLGRPAGPDPADTAGGRQRRGRSRRVERRRSPGAAVAVAAVVVVVLLATAVGTVVAPVREAVAGWLGIGTTEVVRVGEDEGDPGDLPFLGDELVPVARATAERRLGAALPDTSETDLGPPPVLATPPEGGVILAWDDGATTLWVRRTDMPPDQTVDKLITFDDRLERIDDLGDDAAIVEGPHVLGTPLRRLAAGTVLVWVDGGLEHRLESDLDPAVMVEIARTITPS